MKFCQQNKRLYLLAALFLSTSTYAFAEIQHGSIELLVDPVTSSSSLSLGPDTTNGVILASGSNRGDYWLGIDPPGAQDEGIIISSVTQNGRGGNYAISSGYPSSGTAQRHFISIHQAAITSEDDINVAFAFFPKDEFLVGQATNSGDDLALDALEFASSQIAFSTASGQNSGAELIYDGTTVGVSTLDLTGLGASSQDGILLVNGAKNENNFALSKANSDGTFTIYNHDAAVNGAVYESDPVSFAYLSIAHNSKQIVALGRISGDGTALVGAGNFTVTSGNDGSYTLSISGYDNDNGTLIISPEGGGNLNADNIWSYQWDSGNKHWVIETRDLVGLGLQDLGTEPAFSFAFCRKIITVTTSDDEDDGPSSLGSPSDISLREAINYAGNRNLILFDASLDGDTISLNGSELLIAKSLTIDASNLPNGIIIDGGGNGDFVQDSGESRCLFIYDGSNSSTITVTLNNLTLQNGSFEGNFAGANLRNAGEHVTLNNCQILNGRAFGFDNFAFGGGIYSEGGNLTLNACTVSNNQTQGENSTGGGICSGNIFSSSYDILILNSCTVSNNQTQGSEASGGGIYSHSDNLTLNSCTISDNQTQGSSAEGGGIYISDNGSLTLISSMVLDNQTMGSDASGGGICSRDSILTLISSTVSNNQTQGSDAGGGGIYSNRDLFSTPIILTNCTLSGNSALNAWGGGLLIERGLSELSHCTITGNTAPNLQGSGMASFDDGFDFADAVASITACIIAGNTNSDIDFNINPAHPIFSGSHNLIGTGSGVVKFNQSSNQTGVANPLLSPLGNYGGSTQTMLPLPGSPALDAATASTETSDQRGFPRPLDGDNSGSATPDIGASEAPNWATPSNTELASIFATDSDGDGNVYGQEIILGTDPFTTDSSHSNNFGPLDGGIIGFSFGRDQSMTPAYQVDIYRSFDLLGFTKVFSYSPVTHTQISVDPELTPDFTNPDKISITDATTEPKVFYQLRIVGD